HGHGECAFDGADAAVEGELAGDEVFLVVDLRAPTAALCSFEDAVYGEDAQCHGEFEGVAFFAEVGRGEVDGEAAFGEAVAAVVECRVNAVEGFFYGGVGEADDGGLGLALGFFGMVDFDLAGDGVDTLQHKSMYPRQHRPSLDKDVFG